MARRIKKLNVRFISLVPKGANNIATIYKAGATAEEGTLEVGFLVKSFNEDNGELTAVVYAPENRDTQGDIADGQVIKDGMYAAMRDGVGIDIKHNEKAVSKAEAYIAEYFIVQKGDPRFADTKDYSGKPVDVTGAWGVVIKIEDAALRAQYREGKWGGVSMGGTAVVEQEKSAPISEDTMTQQELEAAITKSNAPLVAAISGLVTTLTPQVKKEAEKPDAEAIAKAEGDKRKKERKAALIKVMGDPLALKRQTLLFQKADLIEKADVDDMGAFLAAQGEMAEIDKAIAEVDAEIKAAKEAAKSDDPNAAEIAKLQARINPLSGRSNQPVSKSGGGTPTGGAFIGIEKGGEVEDPAAEFALGSKMAKAMNAQNGRAPQQQAA